MKDQNQETLIRYRLEQAELALEEANLLMSQGRTTLGAVNRAYYAMFYAVLALLQPKRYDEAVSLLLDLKDLADYMDHVSVFSSQMRALVNKHLRKDTLIKKIQQGKLLKEIIKEGL